MNRPSEPIGELDLLAYADGLLDPARRAAVERHLAAHAEDAARIDAYGRQNQAISACFGAVKEEPTPERIMAAIYRRPASPSRRFRPLSQIAAGVCAILAAGLLGWYAGRVKPPEASISAFVEEVQRLAESGEEEETPWLEAPDVAGASSLRQLAHDLATHLASQRNDGQSLTFMRQRVITHNGQEIAQFTFKDQSGKPYRLFMTARPRYRGPSYKLARGGEGSVAYWADGPIVFALAGDDKPAGGDPAGGDKGSRLVQFAQAIDRAVCTEDQLLLSASY